MHDIYHNLTRGHFKDDNEADLQSYINASEDGYHGIMSCLQVMGNLAVAATSNINDNYDGDSARSDLFLLGTALTQLTRIAEAIYSNWGRAEFELSKRKPGGAA